MARYIIQDAASGYIYGDTADLDGAARDETPIEAARRMDKAEELDDREYEEVRELSGGDDGYLVYRADVDGSEAVTVCIDGQDAEYIEAVERDCDLVAIIRCVDVDPRDEED